MKTALKGAFSIFLRLIHHSYHSDSYRTLFSRLGVFFPVSHRRWLRAQAAEIHSWDLPEVWSTLELHPSFINEGIKSSFLFSATEKAFEFNLDSIIQNRVVIDVGCGPCSAITTNSNALEKFGIDPFPFPKWVIDRYLDNDFRLIPSALEELDVDDLIDRNPVVIFYNALQHFWSPTRAFKSLRKQFGQHDILIIEYVETSADRAHPQILTISRILRLLKKHSYNVQQSKKIQILLPGLVEYGNGRPAQIACVYAHYPNKSVKWPIENSSASIVTADLNLGST